MYGGKHIAAGDTVFLFASENAGGAGLIAMGVVTSTAAVPRPPGPERWTPRVCVTVRRMGIARGSLGRAELRPHRQWDDGRPETEPNFKFHRQPTDRIAGVSDAAAAFLLRFFPDGESPSSTGRAVSEPPGFPEK